MSDFPHSTPVEIAPLAGDGHLAGFLLLGRWPEGPVEWAKVLTLTVRLAAVPGLLQQSTVFVVADDRPERTPEGTVGLIMAKGGLVGDHALAPGQFAHPQPHGLLVLHPPAAVHHSVPGYDTAAGCVFLPGLPHLGLEHQAAWVEADSSGSVTHLLTRTGVDPYHDGDTAALATLLAA